MDADTREALEQRIQLATPEDQVSGLFCENAYLAIREMLGRDLADSVRASTWPLRPWASFQRYPVAELLRMMGTAADLAEKQGLMSYPQALEEIGGWVTRITQGTPFSRAAHLAVGNEPHERLALSQASARVLVTYGERKYEREGPTHSRLLYKRELMGPSFLLGAYVVIAQSIPGVHITVTLGPCLEPGMNFQLHCSW
ncbi:uncharacterized protein (TIGR02265 family) [Archangium gephyra]|uniref:Uncharacterized protein (TIGR02265 family) n=1 Tax=Archangium gephyra TaxID=48 RepID=A0AAC8Q331_9BACT|nr:DUF2378 family protein [Archangium gephyra]AKJ00153.1 Hypothetical protein AA314_01779 [Archangium gephyra]REG33149.1 uncharacterized protein (TIGR02265 family) [Archangium gephyra]